MVITRARRNQTWVNQKNGVINSVWKLIHIPPIPCRNTSVEICTAPVESVALPKFRKNCRVRPSFRPPR